MTEPLAGRTIPRMPPIPPPAGVHPLVVHFPIALLMVVPVFLALGLALPRQRSALASSALLLMTLGTIAAYVAVKTGGVAEHGVEMTREQHHAVHEHEELAEKVQVAFTVLTIVFLVLVAAERGGKTRMLPLAHGLFLVAYLAGVVLLANTAHHGGLAVHGYGIRAPVAGMPPGDAAPASPDDSRGRGGDDD